MDRIVQYLVNGFDFFIRRRMEDNDDGTDEADGASELAERPEFLF